MMDNERRGETVAFSIHYGSARHMLYAILYILDKLMRLWFRRNSYSDRIWRRRLDAKNLIRSCRKPDWVITEVIRLKALMPDAGARRIAHCFNRRFAATRSMTVSKSFVAYTLRREAYRIADMCRAIRRRHARIGRRNLVWGIDLTGKHSADKANNTILGIIDHGTRMLLHLGRPERATAWTALGYLFLTIGKYGKPKAIRTDNASVFTARLFRLVLRLTGIGHQRTEPGSPWMNGRIERLFGTLKAKLDLVEVATAAALSHALVEFRFWYNEIRPHQNLGGCTPHEIWHGIDPFAQPPRKVEWFSAWDGLLTGFIHRR